MRSLKGTSGGIPYCAYGFSLIHLAAGGCMSLHMTDAHLSTAARFVDLVKAKGMPPMDLPAFWAANAEARKSPFSRSHARIPLEIMLSDECVFDELGEAPDWRRLFHDPAYHASICRRYNDKAQHVIGIRPVQERLGGDGDPAKLPVKTLGDIFEGRNEWRDESWSYWLHQSANTPDELSALLDRVERRLERLEDFLFPPDWERLKKEHLRAGRQMPLYRHQRGPVTFATSIYGVENTIFLIVDNPGLAARFRDVILRAILERARLMDREAGFSPDNAPRSWSWADDNCALLTPDMYREFAAPVVRGMFDTYAPGAGDRRYQHSDSNMEHLLPVLGTLGFTEVNFGPTLSVEAIRRHLPLAVIDGQLAPMTFCRNEEVNIVAELLRDFEMSREARGVVFSTAGSVNAGSRLSGMRLLMAAVQELCGY